MDMFISIIREQRGPSCSYVFVALLYAISACFIYFAIDPWGPSMMLGGSYAVLADALRMLIGLVGIGLGRTSILLFHARYAQPRGAVHPNG